MHRSTHRIALNTGGANPLPVTQADALRYGCVIRQSTIEGAGLGLFLLSAGKQDDKVGDYWGWQIVSATSPADSLLNNRYDDVADTLI